ncbi:MAG: hypothetical protein ACJA1A_001362 [Saprospiraceae bacterium]|jgi:uncharacterized protein YndB with AHSA1/START domain
MELIKEVAAQMTIRRPASEVYQAFINPEITKQFWFTDSSGPLELHKTVTWKWKMYGVSAESTATEVIPNEMIKMKWVGSGSETTVEFHFISISPSTTYLSIKHYGFDKEGMELQADVLDSMGGFNMVLAGCKAWLEQGVNINLIADKYPEDVAEFYRK